MADTVVHSGGVGVCGLLGVLFVGLKLGGVIDWSWLWVLAPFWVPLLVAFVVGIAAVLLIAVFK